MISTAITKRGATVSEIALHFAPDSCARVPLIALEEIGCSYKLEIVTFTKGQQRSTDYLALNPKGKVPTLVVNGEVLTENVAILSWLSERFPQANLLPRAADAFGRAQVISDLVYCASGLHPIVTRLRKPQFFCDTSDGTSRVFEMAEAAMRPNFVLIERRLGNNSWWYGERWSIVDAYINWVWFRVRGTTFEASTFTNLARHDEAINERPAVKRASAVNNDAASTSRRGGCLSNSAVPDPPGARSDRSDRSADRAAPRCLPPAAVARVAPRSWPAPLRRRDGRATSGRDPAGRVRGRTGRRSPVRLPRRLPQE